MAKQKKCKSCGDEFTPDRSFQKACSPKCAISLVADNKTKAKAKEWRKEKKAIKEKLKTRSDWLKECQKAFNRFVRLRDRLEDCISCGRSNEEVEPTDGWKIGGSWDCGHFLTVGGFPELRFEPLNAHKQCKSCNAGSSKYARKSRTVGSEYRERLIGRIGLEKVEWLEGPHDPKKYSIEEIKAIKAKYTKLAKELEAKAVD